MVVLLEEVEVVWHIRLDDAVSHDDCALLDPPVLLEDLGAPEDVRDGEVAATRVMAVLDVGSNIMVMIRSQGS